MKRGGDSEEDSDGDGNVYKRGERGHVVMGKEEQAVEAEEEEEEGNYDLIPHQIRGSLSTFTQISPMVRTTPTPCALTLTLHCTALPLDLLVCLPPSLPSFLLPRLSQPSSFPTPQPSPSSLLPHSLPRPQLSSAAQLALILWSTRTARRGQPLSDVCATTEVGGGSWTLNSEHIYFRF